MTIDLPAEAVARKPSATAEASSEASAMASEATQGEAEAERAPAEPLAEAAAAPETGAPLPPEEHFGGVGEPHPAAKAERRPGLLALAVASIVGGAIVAFVVVLLVLAGYLAPLDRGESLSAEMAALRDEVTQLRAAAAQDGLQPLRDEIATMKQSLDQVAARETAVAADPAALQNVETRLAELERLANSGAGPVGAALDARVAALADAVAALKASGGVPAETESAVGELRDAVSGLSARLDAMRGEERIAAIETRIDALGKAIDSAAALGPAVAAEALHAALESGQPFTTELAALRTLGVDAEAVEGLLPYAESGLPTIATLRRAFDTATASIDLSTPVAEGTGTIGRLLESARGLVEVRPAYPTEGADPAAIVTRIKGALAAEDLKTALAEWSSLPDGVKTATADWARSAETRLAADLLVAKLRADALAQLKPAE